MQIMNSARLRPVYDEYNFLCPLLGEERGVPCTFLLPVVEHELGGSEPHKT